jgi:recombination protein RecT
MSSNQPNLPAKSSPGTLKKWLESEQFKSAIALALPKHMTADRFMRVAITCTLKVPKLGNCSQESVLNCLLTLSQLGLEPDGRLAHLVPFGNTCTLILDYKGVVELAMRSGLVSVIHADVVCENDVFVYELGEIKKHKIDFTKPRGDVYAVYAICKFKDGGVKAEVMTRDEVERVRQAANSRNSDPWKIHWPEMAKKTAFKRLSKWIPLSPEIRKVLADEDDSDFPRTVSIQASNALESRPHYDQLAAALAAPQDDNQAGEPDPETDTGSEPDPEPVQPARPASKKDLKAAAERGKSRVEAQPGDDEQRAMEPPPGALDTDPPEQQEMFRKNGGRGPY